MMQRLLLLERCIDLISAHFLTSNAPNRDFTMDDVREWFERLAQKRGFTLNFNNERGVGLIINLVAGRTDYIDFTKSFILIHHENTRGRVENFNRAENATWSKINLRIDLINYLKTKLPWPKERDLQFIDGAFAVLKTD